MIATKPWQRALSPAVIVCGAIGLAWTARAVATFWADPLGRDFGSFYRSGAAWLAGTPLYAGPDQYPNLNPPGVVAVLFAPLAMLPVQVAAALWLAIGASAVSWMLLMVFDELRVPLPCRAWSIVALAVSMPNALAWSQGQLTWILLVPVTLGWRALRRGSPSRTGFYIGLVIAAKPFLVILPFVLGWRVTLAAGLTAGSLTLAAVVWQGLEPWREWLALSAVVDWFAWPANASIWGVLARAAGSGPLSGPTAGELPLWVKVVGAALAVSGGALSLRLRRDPDRAFLAGGCLALLAAPLGWVYYVPWILGPYLAIALVQASRLDWLALAFLVIPLPILGLFAEPAWLFATAGSVYAWALLIIWWRAVQWANPGAPSRVRA